MSSEWMLRALLVGMLLCAAATNVEQVAGWLGVPRRSAWAAAMLGSLVLPLLAVWAPGLVPGPGLFTPAVLQAPSTGVGAPPTGSAPGIAAPATPADAAAPWGDLSSLLGAGWLAASLAVLGVVALTYRRLRAARAACPRAELDGCQVLVSDHVGPAVVGLLHPAVVVPGCVLDAPAGERRLILLHEREHVSAGDTWLLLLGALAVAAMPWNPALWWQQRRLRDAVESACDARVLARGASRREYGQALIRIAGCASGLPRFGVACGGAASRLERRIMEMTAGRPSYPVLRAVPLLVPVVILAVAACDLAAGRGVTTPSRPDVPGLPLDTLFVTPDPRHPRPTASVGWAPAAPARLSGSSRRPRFEEFPRVAALEPGGGAWRAGLRGGDEVLAIGGDDARDIRKLAALVRREPGTRYVLRVRRDGVVRELTAELDPPREDP